MSTPTAGASGPLVLGIESSCDETGVGIVRGNELLANEVASSVEQHVRFGGVVPEVASRAHLEALIPTLRRACESADIDLAQGESGPALIDPDTGRPRKFAYAPSLVVVDGGPPQVAAAAAALDELGIDDVAVCGLAKRLEEVWLPGQDDPVILPRTSEGLYLLQRMRDEAHRFAIQHHRQRRSVGEV